jgi:hypothetical protein
VRAALLALAALFLPAAPLPAAAEDPPPPAPPPAPAEPAASTETLHGLRVDLLVPAKRPEEGWSLLLYLHSHVGTGKEAATFLRPFVDRGFVIAAPWSKTGDWTAPEFEAAGRIFRDLAARHEVARERRHAVGFWTGGGGVATLAFDESLGLRTATWIDAAWGGGSIPKGAKEELRAAFLWGAREGPSRIDRYRKSASMLGEKVRACVAEGEPAEPGLGRGRSEDPAFPKGLLPFLGHFLECAEGRFDPARDHAFPWLSDLEAARAEMAARKTGGFAVIHAASPEGAEWDRAKHLGNEVLFDRVVRHFGGQLVPVRLEKGAAKELMAAAKVTETPAVIVFKRGGKEILRAVAGEVKAKDLVPLLRAAAPDPEMPK